MTQTPLMSDTGLLSTGPMLTGTPLYYAIALAALLLLLGGAGLLTGLRDRAAPRMKALARAAPAGPALSKTPDAAPRGLARALIPEDPSELAQLRFQLGKAGFTHARAVPHFFLARLGLALLVPLGLTVALALSQAGLFPAALRDLPPLGLMQIAAVGAALGFYGPMAALRAAMRKRQQRIRNGFPNALDLLQISVESGLGFDAALSRVGTRIGRVSPDIALEFLTLQNEVQAGRDRAQAMAEMAERMGIPEAKSFALVVTQSMQYGTSLTAALRAYASEMRQHRELAAQEKANRLPVQMSAVMSLLMLPALFLITLTPIIIRYTEIY